MRFIYETGNPNRKVHIQKFNIVGDELNSSICGMKLPYNRSINVALEKGVCKNCVKKYNNLK